MTTRGDKKRSRNQKWGVGRRLEGFVQEKDAKGCPGLYEYWEVKKNR